MKQLVVLSGKGGTGKTTVASALIKLSKAKAYADCDVDAPNLHLLLDTNVKSQKKDYYGMQKAFINQDKCIGCSRCMNHCKFNAIDYDGDKLKVNTAYCEGCGVCEYVCPRGAITFRDDVAGTLEIFNDDDKVFSTAELKMGSGTSGKLVTEVKNEMRENSNASFSIVDGSPGIGCPVIATLSGASAVLLVAEPSISGISDMKRIIDTAKVFRTKVYICVNKYDVNTDKTNEIEQYAKDNNLSFLGKIPYDISAVKAINNGKSVIDIDCSSGNAIREIYKKLEQCVIGGIKNEKDCSSK